jgi:hypothetical protein
MIKLRQGSPEIRDDLADLELGVKWQLDRPMDPKAHVCHGIRAILCCGGKWAYWPSYWAVGYLVKQTFHPDDFGIILSIPLSDNMEDIVARNFNQKGLFSVKSE